jgi:hypothetical protein
MSKESQLRKTNQKARLRHQGRLKRDADSLLLDAALTRLVCKVADHYVPGLNLMAVYDESLKKASPPEPVVPVITLKPNKDGVYE